ncbi:class I SAM-dependent methyltransferase [Arenibacter echinorum]|uniref:Methyltransferase family protein n=1 Tax=Arenibacter echinorum TaxID=440515 RepID=A0A327RAY0_9FLAO|nr:class I SAM-dependent methyltransferase [Arenibacter echinorum]RAJ13959.1 methyltransferase family protein [Arenibacter echinorum]|tara:strand:+ start:5684 stop:6739 length:1056 start_codon:yes stop_codon:yes gene_type:complete
MELNEAKLNELLGKVVTEMGAAANGPLILLGDKLGLFKSLAVSGPMNSTELADETNTAERYVREWLSAQAASGYVSYDATTNSFSMTPEQAAVFGDAESPVFMTGAFYAITSVYNDAPKMEKAFKSGEGVAWGDHSTCLFCGTEKFFSPSYENNLVNHWIPSLDGVDAKLKNGAKVADIGCGHAASTIIMAKAYPKSTFIGYDYHAKSIEHARESAAAAGLDNISFEVALAKDFPGSDYDFIAFFDCLHDMGDPVGACAHVKKALKPDGTCMIVEPFANDSLEENLNPVGRAFYAFSTTLCTPCSLNQEVGLALGAQAGEKRLREVATSAGFTRFRRATETPFNLILEARA